MIVKEIVGKRSFHMKIIKRSRIYCLHREVYSLARPRKCRRVCRFPYTLGFSPEYPDDKMDTQTGNDTGSDTRNYADARCGADGAGVDRDAVVMTVDEYETIRLIDKEGMSQEQCSDFMQIARTTVQHIYTGARRKLADALVDGRPLRIGGGDYQLCDGGNAVCCRNACWKQEFSRIYAGPKGEGIMRIAVTYENGEIFQHFGHTEYFKVYDTEDGNVVSSKVVSTEGNGHGALAGILSAMDVDTLICGGIGGGARSALATEGIELCGGVSGSADDAVKKLLAGELDFDPDVQCSHHGGHDHGHNCGSHSCGR